MTETGPLLDRAAIQDVFRRLGERLVRRGVAADQPHLDLATIYRNLVKECALGRKTRALHVMMKGIDWVFDCQLVYRSFTVMKLGLLIAARPSKPQVRGIYKRYFDLIASGSKTTEVRVNDSSRKKIKVGSFIRFRCQGDEVLTRVTRIARYATFEMMLDREDLTSVNPMASREQQLANIRQIYPAEREALGVLAIGIELADHPRSTRVADPPAPAADR